jgi:hypothetical protein
VEPWSGRREEAPGRLVRPVASRGQGSKFRSIFGEISVFFPFSLDTGNRNFGRFRDFLFRNLKIQKNYKKICKKYDKKLGIFLSE